MTTPARGPIRSVTNSRRVPRCPLAVPVRVTVQGPTTAYGIPGRSLDLGEGGIAAVLAGEVRTGDAVGVEFLLPELGLGLQTKAVVRHQADLRCGLEFYGLSIEQQAMIRRWTRKSLERHPEIKPGVASGMEPATGHAEAPHPLVKLRPNYLRSKHVLAAAAGVLLIVGLGIWRYWEMQWTELREQINHVTATQMPRVKLAPGVIDPLVIHKVDAVQPEGVKNPTGVVLLHIVVGTDGTVIDERPESGSDELSRAAMEAVKDWRFQPYRVNGATAEVETTVVVEFGS
jgi:TonB family protein